MPLKLFVKDGAPNVMLFGVVATSLLVYDGVAVITTVSPSNTFVDVYSILPKSAVSTFVFPSYTFSMAVLAFNAALTTVISFGLIVTAPPLPVALLAVWVATIF